MYALYLRKSREEQNENREETLARHERMLIDYAEKNNLIIKDVYKEVVSGESIAQRPQMQRLLENINMYEGVIVVELERLSRGNGEDQARILRKFQNANTKIHTLAKVYDLSSGNDFDEEFFEFGLFMSRREYKLIKRRLIRGKKQAQQEGYYIGSHLPYGFTKEKINKGYVLQRHDYEAKIVELIFNKYVLENCSIADIRHYLNDNGIKPHKVEFWTTPTIRKILGNHVYIGKININSRSSATRSILEGKHDPIIDVDLFYQAQTKLALSSAKVKKDKELKNPLAGLVYCSHCGSLMQRHNEYLRCTKYKCPIVLSYFDIVENEVINALKSELKDFEYFLENYVEEEKNKKILIDQELDVLNKELQKKEIMINKACEMLELGVYTKEKYLHRVNILENEKKSLYGRISTLNNNSNNEELRIKNAIPILDQCINNYFTLSNKDRNLLLKSIIEKIEYKKTIRNNRWNNNLGDMCLKVYLKI